MPLPPDVACYRLIAAHYAGRRAARSGVPYMQHIDEGLAMLDALGASADAMRAYCLHPLVQEDAAFAAALAPGGPLRDGPAARLIPAAAVALAVEYRRVANGYLSSRVIGGPDEIELSPLAQVNLMLVADKAQNRADFEEHHEGNHPRSTELAAYFRNWLARLGVTEARYRELAARMKRAEGGLADGAAG